MPIFNSTKVLGDLVVTGDINTNGDIKINGENLTAADVGAAPLSHTHTYDDLTGVVPTWNQSTTGNAGTATVVNGTSGQLTSKDDRIIEPNSITAGRLQFGFTSFDNNNITPYADYLHLRSYLDASGGLDNLVMFRKDVIGMRIYQQTFGSATAYSTFKDVAFTDSNISGTAAVSTAATITHSSTNSAFKVPFANTTGASATGNYGLLQDTENTFTYNPSTNTLIAGTFSGSGASLTSLPAGNLTGNISIDRLPTITVAKGGTGATDAGTARTNLGLGNIDNTSDVNKPVSTAQQTALNLKVNTSAVGALNGVASLDSGGKVPFAQLPSSVTGGMRFGGSANLTAGTTEALAVGLNTIFTELTYANFETTGFESRGLYRVVINPGFVKNFEGTDGSVAYFRFQAGTSSVIGEEGDDTSPIYLEKGDWIVLNSIFSPAGGVKQYYFSIINNTYADATSVVKGVVTLSQSTSLQDDTNAVITESVLQGLLGTGADQLAVGNHTHAIANVTGLQTALDGKLGTGAKAADSELLDGRDSTDFVKANDGQLASTDLNSLTATDTTVYYSNTSYGTNSNIPFANYFTMLHMRNPHGGSTGAASDTSNDRAAQLWFGDTPGNIYWRAYQGAAGWKTWEKLWTSGNFNPASYLTTSGKAADSDLLDGLDSSAYLRDDGFNEFPGQDANTQPNMKADFTYSNNAPHNGSLISFGAGGYQMQLNGTYGGTQLSFRNRNGDNATWNTWREIIHAGNIGSQSVNYADNTQKLYSTDSTYNFNSGNPYYGYLTYNGTANRWRFQVSPATPSLVEVSYADTAGYAADSNLLDGIDSSAFLRSNTEDRYDPTRLDFGFSGGWDGVGFGNLTNLHFRDHDQFWIGAGNGTWFTGTANTKSQASGLAADATYAHDLLLTTMQSDANHDRGITFAVDNTGAGNSGWRLGKWHSGTNASNSMFAVNGQIHAKGGHTDSTDYYEDDYSNYFDDGQGNWVGDANAGWHKPSIVAAKAIQIQSGTGGTNTAKPQIQFHQYGYGGPAIEYDGPNKTMTIGETGTSASDRLSYVNFKNVLDVQVNSNKIWHAGNDGAGSTLDADTVDGLHATSFLRSNADSTLISTLFVDSTQGGSIAYIDSAGTYIPRPSNASYKTTSTTVTGALTVRLPGATPSDMMSFWIDVMDYAGNPEGESVSIYVYGYAYITSSPFWTNVGALILSDRTDRDYNVRFGYDGTNHVVCVGETTSTWSYPQVIVRDFQAGYDASASTFDDGWSITFLTTLPAIGQTASNNYPVAKDSGLLNGFASATATTANTIVRRDANGYIYGVYINSSRANETTAAASYIYDTGDGWMRKKTLANAQTEIVTSAAVTAHAPSKTGTGASGTWGINVSGSAATLTTARTLTIGSTGKTFNGSADVSWSLTDIGLGNVNNTSDANKPVSTATQTALDLKLNTSLKGANSGLAELDSSGKVPASQLPSYVDDVIMFDPANNATRFSSTNPTTSTSGSLNEVLYSFQSSTYYLCVGVTPPTYTWTGIGGGGTIPADGFETGKIYVTTTSNKTYRWSAAQPKDGSIVEISASLALGSTSATAHRGDHGATAYTHSQVTNGTNPHGTTFANIASKPTTLSGYGITDAALSTHTHTIANITNLQTALDGKAPLASPTFTGTVTASTINIPAPSGYHAKIFYGQFPNPAGSLNSASGDSVGLNNFGQGNQGIIIQTGGGDTGGLKITDDGVFIFGASDTGLFSIIDEDSNISRFSINSLGNTTVNGTLTVSGATNIITTQRLASAVSTAVNTTPVQVFSFTNLAAGTYQFFTTGRIDKVGSTSSRRYEVYFTCDDTANYSNILGFVTFSPNSGDNNPLGITTLNHTTFSTATSSITSLIGQGFAGTTAATAVSGMIYGANGTFTIAGARNFRMHIKQTAGSSSDIVRVQAGSFMNLYRVG